MKKHDGWAWKADDGRLHVWFDYCLGFVVGTLAPGPPNEESEAEMDRMFGPGRWVKVRVVEVEE